MFSIYIRGGMARMLLCCIYTLLLPGITGTHPVRLNKSRPSQATGWYRMASQTWNEQYEPLRWEGGAQIKERK